ncbi:hypothetical protein [Clostridium sp.]|uniref:hypothetical protein n=1 Tax=Clostridium sp. TaxID=1506 RepID=UPI002FC5FEEE
MKKVITSTLLPNSNLPITVLRKIVITPHVIIKKDPNKAINNLKRGEGHILKLSTDQRYTNKDEYYNEVLKLIR